MKKSLLYPLLFCAALFSGSLDAQILRVNESPAQVVPEGTYTFSLEYNLTEGGGQIQINLYRTVADGVNPDFGTFQNQIKIENLEATGVTELKTVTGDFTVNEGQTLSADLPAGVGYTFYAKLLDASGAQVKDVKGADLNVEVVATLGVNDVQKVNKQWVYPNPAQETIYLHQSVLNAKKLFVYNMLGKVVKQVELTPNTETVDVSSLASGIYILRTDTNQTMRLIKQD